MEKNTTLKGHLRKASILNMAGHVRNNTVVDLKEKEQVVELSEGKQPKKKS